MGTLSRRKGASFERKVASMLRAIFPTARRGLGQARNASEVGDVTADGIPWQVECKHHKNVSIQAAYRQALAAGASKNLAPLVVSRDNGGPILVTMSFEEFTRLVAEARMAEEAKELAVTRLEDIVAAQDLAEELK